MFFKVFCEVKEDALLLKDYLKEDDSIEIFPLSDLFTTIFSDLDFIVIFADTISYAIKVTEALKVGFCITAFIKHNSIFPVEPMNASLRIIHLPCNPPVLKRLLDEERNFRNQTKMLKEEIVGSSQCAHLLRSMVIQSSMNDYPVNLTGETGTGKTMAAKLIHQMSGKKRNLVYINCSNLKTSISDSDLFGHVKGAYTNASQSRGGLLEKAHESTLFLDEIGDLSEEVQGKLLDTIENGTYRSIGSDMEKNSHFRLVTAGQESLESLLEQKKLREDFYYRISGMKFTISPLRQHPEDIPELITNYEEKRQIKDIRIYDYSSLIQREWKGNIRELIHYLDRIYLTYNHTRKAFFN